MITNNSLTVYHKVDDEITRTEKWIRYNYDHVWFFGGVGASTNLGYEYANDVQIRIPYGQNPDLDSRNFSIGDIAVAGTLNNDIESQQDLQDQTIYNITSINNNTFGSEPHIHLSGK